MPTAALFSRWEEIVGPDVASHVQPVVVRGSVLHLEADHPGWATQMRFLEADLLRRLTETVGPGVVETVQVRIRRDRPRP